MGRHQVSDAFKQKLKYARTLLMATQPFYASLLVHADVTEVPNVTGDKRETAYTDGKRIHFFHGMVQDISREEFAFVLLHEVMHLALAHVPRLVAQHLNPGIWNLATDFVINLLIDDLIEQMRRERRPDDLRRPDWVLFDPQYRNMSAEAVYQKLIQELPPDVRRALSEPFGGPQDGQQGQGSQPGDEDRTPNLADFLPNFGQGKYDVFGDIQREAVGAEELQKSEQEWKHAISSAAQQAKLQGKMPAGLERLVNEILYPKLDWRVLLNEFIQQFPVDYAWHQPDRRFTDFPFVIPGLDGEQVELVFAVDTSGSFSPEQLKEALTEAYNMVSAFNYVDMTVISCDAKVHTVTTVHSRSDLEKVRLVGGGGTDFRPVFDWVREHKPHTNGLVYFTDLMGTFPNEAPSFKVLWIANGAPDPCKASVPFGRVIEY